MSQYKKLLAVYQQMEKNLHPRTSQTIEILLNACKFGEEQKQTNVGFSFNWVNKEDGRDTASAVCTAISQLFSRTDVGLECYSMEYLGSTVFDGKIVGEIFLQNSAPEQ